MSFLFLLVMIPVIGQKLKYRAIFFFTFLCCVACFVWFLGNWCWEETELKRKFKENKRISVIKKLIFEEKYYSSKFKRAIINKFIFELKKKNMLRFINFEPIPPNITMALLCHCHNFISGLIVKVLAPPTPESDRSCVRVPAWWNERWWN
jgi:hypothetical protein